MKTKIVKLTALLMCFVVCASLAGCRFAGGGGSNAFEKNKWVMQIGNYKVMPDDFIARSAVLSYRDQFVNADGYVDPQLEQYIIHDVSIPSVIQMYTLLEWADEYEYEMDEDAVAEAEQTIDETFAQFATDEEKQAWLDSSYYTEESYRSLVYDNFRVNKFYEFMISAEGPYPQATEADVDAYLEENPRLAAKHILILYDAESEDQSAKEQEAQAILNRLRAGADFDTLMNQYSEDPGLETNPDGYYFSKGEMVESFENAVMNMEVGEISDLVESSSGFHIIMKLEDDTEQYRADNLEGIKSYLVAQYFQEELAQRTGDISIEYASGLEEMTFADIVWTHAKPEQEPADDTADDGTGDEVHTPDDGHDHSQDDLGGTDAAA